ncbi:MAG: histone deacetylase family protein [Deltaproteobacteria bacterium]|nr:histone deacetylase family protein [Deltaproteobacteria bacterium]
MPSSSSPPFSTVALITHPDCALHEMGPGHPEQPARLGAVEAGLEARGLLDRLVCLRAAEVEPSRLERVHSPAYVESVLRASPQTGRVALDPDTAMNPYSLKAALLAAGGVVQGVDWVMAGEGRRAFCAMRPPGHHACRNRAMGFCIFNNIAVGAAHALAVHGCQRVAILDFDIHHGNGTQDIFQQDERVLLCSVFQHPFYPFSGTEGQNGHIRGFPVGSGSTGGELRRVVETGWLPALDQFRPEMVFVSAGFDGRRGDPLGGALWEDGDYHHITARICGWAEAHGAGGVVSTLEGGYDLDGLGGAAAAHVAALLGQPWM